MLVPQHLQEFQASAIAPLLAELNFHSTDDNWFIRQWLSAVTLFCAGVTLIAENLQYVL
jgi:hypothetical protein